MDDDQWMSRAAMLGVSDPKLLSALMTDPVLGAIKPFEPTLQSKTPDGLSECARSLWIRRDGHRYTLCHLPILSETADNILFRTELMSCQKRFREATDAGEPGRKRLKRQTARDEDAAQRRQGKVLLQLRIRQTDDADATGKDAVKKPKKNTLLSGRPSSKGAIRSSSKQLAQSPPRRSRSSRRLERDVGDGSDDHTKMARSSPDGTQLKGVPGKKRGRLVKGPARRPPKVEPQEGNKVSIERKPPLQRRRQRPSEGKIVRGDRSGSRLRRESTSPNASQPYSAIRNEQATSVDDVGHGPAEKPKTPLEHILSFARGSSMRLSKIEKHEKHDLLKKRTSLDTFVGCDEFAHVDLATYLKILMSVHMKAITESRRESSYSATGLSEIESRECDIPEQCFAEVLDASQQPKSPKRGQRSLPPPIHKTMDLVQLVSRLWQKMASMDETVYSQFLQYWYVTGVVAGALSLAIEILKAWAAASASADNEKNRSDLIDACIRLISKVVDSELNPMSVASEWEENDVAVLQMLGKHENWSLYDIIEAVLNYVGSDNISPTRECRISASDICQAYMVRNISPWSKQDAKSVVWDSIEKDASKLIQLITEHKTFWSMTVNCALQTVEKQQQSSDATLAVAFLVAVVRKAACSRRLFVQEDKYRHVLLSVLVKVMKRMSLNPLSFFAEVEFNRKEHPYLPCSVDLVQMLMSFAVLQREMISSGELGKKKELLESIEGIITRSAQFVKGPSDTFGFLKIAKRGAFGKVVDERAYSITSGGEESGTGRTSPEANAADWKEYSLAARHTSLGFAAWLIGSLGKSMEDGSRDISQMNGLQALLADRFISSRSLLRLWGSVYRIQRGLERFLPDESSDSTALEPEKPALLKEGELKPSRNKGRELLSRTDRNHFSIVAEAIRVKLVSDPREGRSTRNSPDTTGGAKKKEETVNFAFPSALKVPQFRKAVSSRCGYEDLDHDTLLLDTIRISLKDRGEQTLARYDPECPTATKWIRLQKKNSYYADARDLLDRSDRILGNPCGCLPGNPGDAKGDTRQSIACSNDLCANRSSKVECTPGECNAGTYCRNQRMQRMEYARFKMQTFPGKGVGVVADEDIHSGSFIGEYQGEVVSMKQFEERKREYEGERHFYFMTLTPNLVIDASRKSQSTRFVNHSCAPNAETQKWNAGGEPRVGIFAIREIPKGEEITFDYGARSLANDTVPCLCQAANCRGYLTVRKEENTATKLISEDAVPVDQAALANSSDLFVHGIVGKDKPDPSIATEEKDLRRSDAEKLKENVQMKIDRANQALQCAAEIREVLDRSKSEAPTEFVESSLDIDQISKLKQWEVSVKKIIKQCATSAAFSVKEPSAIRIPRRGPTCASTKDTPSLLESLMTKKPEVKKVVKKKLVTSKDVYYSVVTGNASRAAPSRQISTLDKAEGLPRISAILDKRSTGLRLVEDDGVRKYGAFVPVASKQKPLPAPKFARRPRQRDSESDVDSLDDYSIASSVEPIVEEPPPLPSDLPDGQGARSDDEFVAASPVALPAPVEVEKPLSTAENENGWVCKPDGGVTRAGPAHEGTGCDGPMENAEQNKGRHARIPSPIQHHMPTERRMYPPRLQQVDQSQKFTHAGRQGPHGPHYHDRDRGNDMRAYPPRGSQGFKTSPHRGGVHRDHGHVYAYRKNSEQFHRDRYDSHDERRQRSPVGNPMGDGCRDMGHAGAIRHTRSPNGRRIYDYDRGGVSSRSGYNRRDEDLYSYRRGSYSEMNKHGEAFPGNMTQRVLPRPPLGSFPHAGRNHNVPRGLSAPRGSGGRWPDAGSRRAPEDDFRRGPASRDVADRREGSRGHGGRESSDRHGGAEVMGTGFPRGHGVHEGHGFRGGHASARRLHRDQDSTRRMDVGPQPRRESDRKLDSDVNRAQESIQPRRSPMKEGIVQGSLNGHGVSSGGRGHDARRLATSERAKEPLLHEHGREHPENVNSGGMTVHETKGTGKGFERSEAQAQLLTAGVVTTVAENIGDREDLSQVEKNSSVTPSIRKDASRDTMKESETIRKEKPNAASGDNVASTSNGMDGKKQNKSMNGPSPKIVSASENFETKERRIRSCDQPSPAKTNQGDMIRKPKLKPDTEAKSINEGKSDLKTLEHLALLGKSLLVTSRREEVAVKAKGSEVQGKADTSKPDVGPANKPDRAIGKPSRFAHDPASSATKASQREAHDDDHSGKKRKSPSQEAGDVRRDSKKRRDSGGGHNRSNGKVGNSNTTDRKSFREAGVHVERRDENMKGEGMRRSSAPIPRRTEGEFGRQSSGGSGVLSRIGSRSGSGFGLGTAVEADAGYRLFQRSRSGNIPRQKQGRKGNNRGMSGRQQGVSGGNGGRKGKRAASMDGRETGSGQSGKPLQASGSGDLRDILSKTKKN